jgi:protein-S-isoprenylcysteine O-methyltransferase Ste14
MSASSEAAPTLRQKIGPILGTMAFFVIAPGTFALFVPWRLTGWRMAPPLLGLPLLRPVGAALALLGFVALVDSFARFAVQGLGTPAPPLPPRRLVVTGLYRHVRNPMYLAVLSIIVGQALLLGRRVLLGYAAVAWLAVHLFVLLYEEPTLRARYGPQYASYRAAVRRWRPRLRPWRG